MRLPARSLSCAALLAALVGCGGQPAPPPAAEAAAPAPVAIAPTHLPPAERASRVLAFVQAGFGTQAGMQSAWRDADGNRPLHRYVCLDTTTTWQGIEHSVLAVCANRDDAGSDEPGLLDAWLLRADADGGLAVAAQLSAHATGLGGIAAAPTLVQLGPDIPALALDTPVAASAMARSDIQLLAALGSQLVEVARFPSRLDNRLHITCAAGSDAEPTAPPIATGEPALLPAPEPLAADAAPSLAELADCDARELGLTTRWSADSSASSDWWPLQIEQTGLACGSAVAGNHRLSYDPSLRRYTTANLMERCQ